MNTARISADGLYRYSLTRTWGEGERMVFVMLNPSTADAVQEDATLRKCRGFAKLHGYAGLLVVNLYALRSRDPRALKLAADPVGPENDRQLATTLLEAATWRWPVVAAWGAHATPARAREFLDLADQERVRLRCLGMTKSGAPRHPLMVPYSTELVPYLGGIS